MKKIIVINGYGGVGKDTVCRLCGEMILTKTISSVDMVKEAARILGWNNSKDEQSRRFLAELKYMSSDYNDHSYKYIKQQIEEFMNGVCELMFIHIREPLEIQRIKDDFGATTVLVTNNNVNHITSNKADSDVFDYEYDYIIDNSKTIVDLMLEVKDFTKKIRESDDD